MSDRTCPGCGHANPEGSRFCSHCGVALGKSDEGSGERRHATVMFADLVGYTSLTERRDPEQVDELMTQFKATARRIVEKHGGIVNQFVGDEIMALFGVPVTDEDDAANAIRAALALHAALDAEARRWDSSEPLALHTGISSGLVIAQYDNRQDGVYRTTGDAVNTAARLRSRAAAGEILVGPTTYRVVAPFFDLELQPDTQLKGKSASIAAYRVRAERRIGSRFDAARERGLRGYVGRTLEQQTLAAALERALAGEGQLVTLEGEPGLGKSRLIHQFEHSVNREHVTVSQGRCQPHGSDIPYFCFLDGMRHGLDVDEHDSHADALRKVVANIERIDPSLRDYLPEVLHLLAIPSDYALPAELKGEALRRALEEALVAIITVATKAMPMIFVIEDWHWSDPTSQSALRALLRLLPSYRLLVLVSMRSGYEFEFGSAANRTAVRLKPLSDPDTETLIRNVTDAAELPPGFGALVGQNADGNPLFVEEACRSLLESGTIALSGQRLVLNQPLDRLLLPDTVQAVIRARLDRLDPVAKEVVGFASVIGRVFSQRIVAHLYRGPKPIDDVLAALQAQEIVRQTKLRPEPEFTFRHVLTREVAYETLLLQHRKRLHGEVGAAIEAFYPERLAENAPILAQHYARSGRADKAAAFSVKAGEQALRLFANAEAASHFDDASTQAEALPDTPGAQRVRVDAIVGKAAAGLAPGDIGRARADLERACELATALGDRPRLARALYWRGRTHYVLAQLHEAVEFSHKSLEIADDLDDAALAAPPVNLMGRAFWQLGDFARSAQMMERSVEQMRVVGDRSEESTSAGFVSALFGYMGEFSRGLAHSDRALQLARELKNPFAEAAGLHYRGIIRDQQGAWNEACTDYTAALRIADAAGDVFRAYIVRFMEGRARQIQGDVEGGRLCIEGAIAIGARIGTTFLLGQAKSFLADCMTAPEDRAMARQLCEEAIALAAKAGDRFSEALARRSLAVVTARSADAGAADEASRLVGEAIELLTAIGAGPELARTRALQASMLPESARAARLLAEALSRFEAYGMRWDRDAAERALRRLGDPDGVLAADVAATGAHRS